MPRPKKIKEPFADVPEEFKDTIDGLSRDEIRLRIATVALAQLELMEAQAADEDYQRLKAEFKEAGAVYREGTKANRGKIAYARSVFEAKGG